MDPTAVTHRGLILLLPSAKCPLGFHCCHPEGSHHCHLLYAPVGPTAVTHRGPIISQVAPCHYSHPEGSHCHHMPLTAVTHRCLILWHHLLYGPMGPTAVTRGSHHCHLPHAPVGPTKVTQGGRTPTTCQLSPYILLLSLRESYCHRLPYIPIVHIAVTRTGPPLSPALCPYGSHCCHPEGSIPLPPPARCPIGPSAITCLLSLWVPPPWPTQILL